MPSRCFRQKPLVVALALTAFFAAPYSLAQAPAAQPDNRTPEQKAADEAAQKAKSSTQQVERVIVTATGRAQPASSVPYNVTAISEEALREGNITDIKKFIALDPSINAPQNSARFADSVTVRGLNVSPVNANNLEQFTRSTLAYYLDDTPLPNIAYRIKDIARVETLLGPQGTLYGAGSLGGTVRYITNQPEFGKLSALGNTSLFQAKGGSFSHDTDAVFNVPLSDNFALRASAARLDDNGYTDRISNPSWRTGNLAWQSKPDTNKNVYKDDDYNRVTSGRLALAWRATNQLKFTLSHAEQDQRANGISATSLLPLAVANANSAADIAAYIKDPSFSPCTGSACRYTDLFSTPTLAGIDKVASRYPEYADRKFRLSAFDVDWNLGFAALRSSTSTFRDTRVGQADYAGQGWLFYYSFGDSGGGFDSGRSAYITFDNSYKGVSHETRLTSIGNGPLSWIAGVYYTKNERSLKFSEYLPGLDAYNGVPRSQAGGDVDEGYRENLASDYKELALYGEVGYRITPQWQVNVGARVFNYDDTAIAQIRDYSFDLVNNNVRAKGGEDGKSYFKFNTSYNFTPEALAYLTVSQGFRRGGTNGFRNVGTRVVAADVQQYQPDSTTNYEIGVKGFFLDRRLYTQLNVYQIDWKDVQTYFSQDIDGFPVNGTANGPSARSRGFEFASRLNVTDNLQLRLASAYTSAEWSGTKQLCLYTNGTACRAWEKGGELGGAPAWKHVFGVRYTTTVANGRDAFVALSGRYYDKVQTDRADFADAVVRVRPAYSIFDLRAGVTWDKLDMTLWVENLANKRAVVSEQRDRVMGPRVIFSSPRTLGVNLSYGFK
ncbi:MAG: TonB-dependent receptor [Betaproteobacteria bacterium]|nr:MAG: TonB-dependent receptor [Betaproteobacteria bacterium]